ncbi:hypothetical protein FNV43_RR20293 [Rhamnella rubrinervis]|uniref:Uncharacterized protein n=1 Tax=Rhamnella rubrinervis TaxID=2594499 RepID=A0A8K0E0W0_9ROSA|nr:hypothetical protein FNV43_RR20293 [Rhamnella rubrinervis]
METMRLTSLQKKHGADVNHQSRRVKPQQQVPDLTDFMNDMFFGSVKDNNDSKNAYNLTGTGVVLMDDDDHDVQEYEKNSSRSSTRLTHQVWLDEARRMVASSPARSDSPSRLVGSPRFAVAQGAQSPSLLDRRDPLSRSARRSRAVESFSGEILSKSTKHSRNQSEIPEIPISPPDSSPASVDHKWFSNILSPTLDSPPPSFHARQSLPRKTRFRVDPSSPRPQGIPVPSRRSFQTPTPLTDAQLLSPPKNLVESAHRRSRSSSTCSVDKIAPKPISYELPTKPEATRDLSLNGFLREQSIKLGKILDDEIDAKAKIVLSGPSNS